VALGMKHSDIRFFIQQLGIGLQSSNRGFVFKNSGEDDVCEWVRPAFEGYDFGIVVSEEPASKRKISFSVGLFVSSTRQADVENSIGIGTCYNPPRSTPSTSVTILYVSLPWLMSRWKPVAGSASEVFLRWKNVDVTQIEFLVVDVLSQVDQYGAVFFDLLQTPLSLANTLKDLNKFPGREGVPSGPLSSNPLEYAAVLFGDLHQPDEAVSCLERDLESVASNVKNGTWHHDLLKVAECKHERYRNWIRVSNTN